MNNILHVISMSGGKDSTASALIALEKHPKRELRFVFMDTGNEHQILYDYLDYLERVLDIQILRLKANFDKQIANKRLFIARDQRTRRHKGRKVRWTNKAKRRALDVLHPSGNSYLDLCLWKGRFASRCAQFCTQYLKVEPMLRYQLSLIDEGFEVVSWQGVRRDESLSRANVLQIEEAADGLWQYRPIADWSADAVFEKHFEHGIKPNPLYKLGMSRVGCMPCINASKNELREIDQRFAEHIKRIEKWERQVGLVSKRGLSSFFANPDKHSMDVPNIQAKVEWAKTTRGGRQYDILLNEDDSVCASAYGLCE